MFRLPGEVPAVVLSVPEGLRPDTQWIKAAVVDSLGLEFAPEAIMSLKEVGLETFPTTSSGKVKKGELRSHLIQNIGAQRLNPKTTTPGSNSTEEALIEVLGLLLGQSPADLPREKSISDLLDSISTLRFLDAMGKRLGKDVTMNHVQGAANLTELAKRIDSDQAPSEVTQAGPPQVSRMSHGSGEDSSKTQRLVQPILEEFGFTWANDVQDVYPMAGTASFFFAREAPYSHQFTAWPIFRCLCAEYEPSTHLWIILKHTEKFLNLAVSEHPDVQDLTELTSLSIEQKHVSGQFPESLSFRAVVADIKSTGTAGFVMLAHHTAYDFLSNTLWRQDLKALLKGETPQMDRVPFKLFADTYYLNRSSILAQRSMSFHLRLLNGISNILQAVWPPKSTPTSQPEATSLNGPVPIQKANLTHCLRLANLRNILSEHTIPAPTIVHTAISLFNTIQTGHSHAIFLMVQASRVWPFLSPEIANNLPNPLNIAGPTVTFVTSVLQIDTQETVETLLHRFIEQQRRLTEHQHVPPYMSLQLKAEDREVWLEATGQVFNWFPFTPVKQENEQQRMELELVKRISYANRVHFEWEAGLMDDMETLRLNEI
ncbi:MAG: hypothetical protein Q9226_001982 [Calogaya cf. arnoldii]